MFEPRPQNVFRKKFRGKRRHFRNVMSAARNFSVIDHPDQWWDFWHYHADWYGCGNLRERYRFKNLSALTIVFKTIAKADLNGLFQTWILLNGDDAGQDATYIHSPNPNGSVFPWYVKDCTWGVPILETIVNKLLPEMEIRVGHFCRCSYDSHHLTDFYVIYSPDVGVNINDY